MTYKLGTTEFPRHGALALPACEPASWNVRVGLRQIETMLGTRLTRAHPGTGACPNSPPECGLSSGVIPGDPACKRMNQSFPKLPQSNLWIVSRQLALFPSL